PVFGAPLRGAPVFPHSHPLWRGDLAPMATAIREALAPFERVLLIGERLLVYPYSGGPLVPDGVEVLHLTADAGQLGRVHATALGLLGDVRASLEALAPLLPDAAPLPPRAPSDFDGRARGRYGDVPMHPMAAVHALLDGLPGDAPIVDEAITTGAYVRGFSGDRPYFFNRGGGLGWGMPAALGVSLARDRSPVVCVVGDGSAMYSPQALWTAAHENLPVVFAVVNNRQYLILKRNLKPGKDYPGLDLDAPPVDFVALAQSMGVPGVLVEKAGDVAEATQAAWSAGGPRLIELPIAAS
nr:thiamine pyrophosphate-binding protein [Actinomycetota bacterium]